MLNITIGSIHFGLVQNSATLMFILILYRVLLVINIIVAILDVSILNYLTVIL